jgi:hypothetical protein
VTCVDPQLLSRPLFAVLFEVLPGQAVAARAVSDC